MKKVVFWTTLIIQKNLHTLLDKPILTLPGVDQVTVHDVNGKYFSRKTAFIFPEMRQTIFLSLRHFIFPNLWLLYIKLAAS